MTERVNLHRACMKGTNQPQPHCVALSGKVGEQVSCTIYDNRPSTCREFSSNSESAEYNAECDKARARHGLPPLRVLVSVGDLPSVAEPMASAS